jgi:hypothetical protein
MKRGAPGERERDLQLTLLSVAQLGDELILHGGQVHGLHEVLGDCTSASLRRGRSSEKRPRETPQQAR